ncbi:DNA translocase FtsK, partial [Paenisporosarcina sp.]|uniref:DNA translocase FtsK n=1 Tax=Paenisporosarcina sp. TaxID=1932001 RepID=UPI003C71DE34
TLVDQISENEQIELTTTEPISEKQIESVIIEQQPTIENVVDEETPVKSALPVVDSTANSTEQVSYITMTEKKKKSLPFNVMMLNSDKAKYQQAKTLASVKPMRMPKEELPSKAIEPIQVEATVEESNDLNPQQDELSVAEDLQLGYIFPKERYLVPPEQKTQDDDWMSMQAARLIESLSYFQVKAEIVNMVQGPAVTQFEMTVGQGTKVSKIRNLADDLKLALAAKDIRIQAPIPGKSSIGIEIPNQTSRPVRLSEVVGSSNFTDSDSPLEAALGLDLTGTPITIDLRKMPHGLIAGATGSGKSVCINSLLISLLYKATPKELNLLLIDPKMVELAPFNHIPHLVSPVITDVKAATAALKWAVEEMERRYQLFAHTGVRDITRYNAMAEEKRQFAQKMPYLLIVIDELADLMMMAPTEVEESICRIAQKARACGIHLVVATQRPSVDVITGLIKANIPTRIAFSVSSQIDSRTILDVQGAERLLGRGDMLYLGNGMSAPIRIQGTYVTDEEMEEIIDHARSQGEPSYLFEQEELVRRLEVAEDQDELFEEACRFILEQGSASTSLLQRKFHIGYNRAARLVDLMEQHGYVSESRGSKAREVFITENDLQLLFND